jgi:hypothetical protein
VSSVQKLLTDGPWSLYREMLRGWKCRCCASDVCTDSVDSLMLLYASLQASVSCYRYSIILAEQYFSQLL